MTRFRASSQAPCHSRGAAAGGWVDSQALHPVPPHASPVLEPATATPFSAAAAVDATSATGQMSFSTTRRHPKAAAARPMMPPPHPRSTTTSMPWSSSGLACNVAQAAHAPGHTQKQYGPSSPHRPRSLTSEGLARQRGDWGLRAGAKTGPRGGAPSQRHGRLSQCACKCLTAASRAPPGANLRPTESIWPAAAPEIAAAIAARPQGGSGPACVPRAGAMALSAAALALRGQREQPSRAPPRELQIAACWREME